MKNSTEVKETGILSVDERLKLKIKELASAPKDISSDTKNERLSQKKEADQIATQLLEKQKSLPASELRHGESQGRSIDKQVFKYELNPKLNKGSDISFGTSGCDGFCKKVHDGTRKHGTYYT